MFSRYTLKIVNRYALNLATIKI